MALSPSILHTRDEKHERPAFFPKEPLLAPGEIAAFQRKVIRRPAFVKIRKLF
jgi:hypothetical protein